MGKALKILIILCTAMSFSAQAKIIKVNAIGSSPKGQFVAIEEFGYQSGSTRPFSRIRVMNMWKNKYVAKPIQVMATDDSKSLRAIREMALKMAVDQFKKFNIVH